MVLAIMYVVSKENNEHFDSVGFFSLIYQTCDENYDELRILPKHNAFHEGKDEKQPSKEDENAKTFDGDCDLGQINHQL